MLDWSALGTIAENIGYALSILGVVGLAWYIADTVIAKIGSRHHPDATQTAKPP